MLNRLTIFRRLSIEAGEGGTALLLSLSQFLIIGGTAVIGRTAGRSLFLSGLPPQYIPLRYIAVTAGLVLTSLLYARIAGRFRRDHLIQRTTVIMIGGLLIFRLLLNTPLATNIWMLGSFYVFLEIVVTLTLFQFWTFAAELVNTRQAKRLFPLVNTAGNLGSMLAGASVAMIVPWLGTPNLLYVLVAILAGYILLVSILGRRNSTQLEQIEKPALTARQPKTGIAQSLHFLRISPLLATMTAVALLMALLVNIIDYQFDLTLKGSFVSNPGGISAFLGSFYFLTGVVGLLVQILLSRRLLQRFGIGAALMILPLGFLTGSVLVLASGAALWAVTVVRSSDTIFRYTLHDTAFNLLYVPVGSQLRSQARAVVDGIFKPLTVGLAGLLFFVVSRLVGITVLPWSVVAILVVVLVLITLLRLRPVYLKTLQDSIRRRYFDPADESLDLSDMTTVALIKNALRQPGEAQLLYAMALADELPNVDWAPALLPLLEHESPLVRVQVLRMFRRTDYSDHAERVRYCFEDPDVRVRASAVFTYWALRGDPALDELAHLLNHVQPEVQSAATSGALRYGGERAREIARPVFESLVTHPQPSVRISAAYALSQLPANEGKDLLRGLLEDPDAQVRLQAVQSVAKLDDHSLLPVVIALLADPVVGGAAGEALVSHGVESFPHLETFYADTNPDLVIRRQVPALVARIPDPHSVRFLLGRLDEPDDLARARVYLALGRLRQAGLNLPEADLALIDVCLEKESRQAYRWALRATSPQLVAAGDLLEDAFTWRLRYAKDRMLYLIAIEYPQANIAQVRANLLGKDERQRANAIELLDTLLTHSHKDLLLPLLEGSPERIRTVAAQVFNLSLPEWHAWCAAALEGSDPWLAACTLFSLGGRGPVGLSHLVRQGLSSPEALVRETALHAARQMLPADDYRAALQKAATLDHDPHIQEYARTCLRLQAGTQEGVPVMTMTIIERILLLRGVELFREIPGQELELIARLCNIVNFAPGERFITQGDTSNGLFILIEGKVEVSTNEMGVIDMRQAGDVIGEIGVLANTQRTANCISVGETTALHISQIDFWDLLERNSSLSVGVIRVLVPRLLEYPAYSQSAENPE